MENSFNQLKNPLLDFLFPKKCVGCGEKGDFFCLECISKIEYTQELICPICHRASIDGFAHPKCQKPFALDRLLTMAYYEGVIQKAILASKFHYLKDLINLLTEIFCDWLQEVGSFDKEAIITAVPLHPKKIKERGFNQSGLLAEGISNYFGLEFRENLLIKTKDTPPQSKLTKKERKENVLKSFKCKNSKEIEGKTILLVDDIVTTGSTLKECGKVLKRNGTKEVIGLTLARGR